MRAACLRGRLTGIILLLVIGMVPACSSGSGQGAPSGRPTTTNPPDETLPPSGTPTTTEPSSFPHPDPKTCGVERQAVKTGEDPGATAVNLTPQATTIAALVALAPPKEEPSARVPPVENTTFQVMATLTAFKLEDDSDYHLVLDDGAGHTMIAEIPSPSCVTGGPFMSTVPSARASFDSRFRARRKVTELHERVTVIGVGFFDRLHGQLGVAPNGIELHPVLSLVFG